MDKTLKLHMIYWLVIIVIIVASHYKNALFWMMDLNKKGFVKINTDLELYNPKTGDLVGYLKKGIILKNPNVIDLDDCDLGDNHRYKLLLDIDEIDRENRKTISSFEDAFNPDKQDVYNKLIVKKAEKLNKNNQEN